MDPLGTRVANVDTQTRKFLSRPIDSNDDGSRLLTKLMHLNYFNQGSRTNREFQTDRKQNVNVLIASLMSSLAIALVVTPFDFVLFKHLARTHGLSR
jgi:hypothetical protein